MSGPAPIRMTPPNFRSARLVGIFNVFFAAQILICGLCMSGYTLTLPMWLRLFSQVQKQTEERAEQLKTAQLEAAIEREKAAKTDPEKIEAAARRIEVETRPKAALSMSMDFTRMGLADPKIIAWSWAELISSLTLNSMMLASGIGLLHWKPWARSLGIWTAALKIVRLVLVYGYFVLSVVPVLAQRMGEAVVAMMAQQPGTMGPTGGAPPVSLFVRIYLITYSGMGVGMILIGVVYPMIVLWLLTRPGVKSACSGLLKLPMEPKQPW